jgi:hypothetical protein
MKLNLFKQFEVLIVVHIHSTTFRALLCVEVVKITKVPEELLQVRTDGKVELEGLYNIGM